MINAPSPVLTAVDSYSPCSLLHLGDVFSFLTGTSFLNTSVPMKDIGVFLPLLSGVSLLFHYSVFCVLISFINYMSVSTKGAGT